MIALMVLSLWLFVSGLITLAIHVASRPSPYEADFDAWEAEVGLARRERSQREHPSNFRPERE